MSNKPYIYAALSVFMFMSLYVKIKQKSDPIKRSDVNA